MDSKPYNKYIILWILQSLLLIFLVPCLEYPDASAHFPKVYRDDVTSYYFQFLSYIREFITNDTNNIAFSPDMVTLNSPDMVTLNASYIGKLWRNVRIHNLYNHSIVMSLQMVNIIICAISIILFNYIVLHNKKMSTYEKNLFIKVNLIYYFIPATSYLMLGATPDFIIYVFQPYLIFLLYRKKIIISLIISVLLLHEDHSAIIDILFCTIWILYYFINKIKIKTSYKIIMVFLICTILCLMIRNAMFNLLFVGTEPGDIMIAMQANEQRMRLSTKFLNTFLTSFGLWGTTYIMFPLFYIFWGILIWKIIIRWIKSKNRNIKFDSLFLVSIIVTIGLIIILPPYSHIRFYMFLIFMIIWGSYIYFFKDEYALSNKLFKRITYILFINNTITGIVIFFKNFLLD